MLQVYKSSSFLCNVLLPGEKQETGSWGNQHLGSPCFLLLLLAILEKEEQMGKGCAAGLQLLLLLRKSGRKYKWTHEILLKTNAPNNSIKKEAWNPIESEHTLTLLPHMSVDDHILTGLHLPLHGGAVTCKNGVVLDTVKQRSLQINSWLLDTLS